MKLYAEEQFISAPVPFQKCMQNASYYIPEK